MFLFINKKLNNPLPLLNMASFMQYLRFVMPISFLFYIYNGLNFSDFILCQSIYSATCLISKLLSSSLGDIFSKKKLLIFAYLLFISRVILWINFSGFWIILTGEILFGLFNAFYKGNIDSYIYEYLSTKNEKHLMTKYFGRWTYYTSIGSAISCILGVILYKYYGFKAILYVEFITQLISISALLPLPDIKIATPQKHNNEYIKHLKEFLSNPNLNYTIFYASILFGLTSIFIWNFQPLLKLSAAPILLFGIINFINQALRGVGGLKAKNILQQFSSINLYKIQFLFVIVSFLLLIISYINKNLIITVTSLLVICIAILFFIIFKVHSTSVIHQYIKNENRAFIASIFSMTQDFTSFIFLLGFKFLHDNYNTINSLIIFAVISIIILLPKKKWISNK